MPVTCPICRSQESIDAFQKRGYSIVDCAKCWHRYTLSDIVPTHVADNYSDDYFCGGQAGYRDYFIEEHLLRRRGRKYARKLAPAAGRSVLDIGSAAGFLLRGFVDEGWTGTGIEPNATMAGFARKQLGLNVINATFEGFDIDEQYDLITMFQVVAHFVDPRMAMEKASTLLAPGGLLLIETWDRRSFLARMLGPSWHEYSPPTVMHWFSRDGLQDLGRQFGLSRRRSGRMIKWISGGHVKSILRYTLAESGRSRLVAAALDLIPNGSALPYPGDDLFWSVLQKTS